ATTDRAITLNNLREALKAHAEQPDGQDKLLELPPDQVGPYFGVGFGHLLLGALSEAMEHENLLEHDAFWDDVQTAIAALGGLPYTPVAAAPPPAPDPASYYSSDYEEYNPAPESQEFAKDESADEPAGAPPPRGLDE